MSNAIQQAPLQVLPDAGAASGVVGSCFRTCLLLLDLLEDACLLTLHALVAAVTCLMCTLSRVVSACVCLSLQSMRVSL